MWVVSMDPRRHRAVLIYLGVSNILFGAIMVGVDIVEGLPAHWSCTEGPIVIGFGAVILWLIRRLDRSD